MDYKSKKLIQIVREFLGNNQNRFEVNGIDLSRAVFFYRERNKKFEPIPKGSYRIQNENNNTYISVDDSIKNKSYEYQVIYEDSVKSSSYNEEFPELKVLVRKYNELQKDVENIVEEIKTTGIKADTSKMTQILTTLEPNTFWATDKNGEITARALGDLNSKYEEMLTLLRRDTEMLIEDVKNSSLNEINEETTRRLTSIYNSYTDRNDELIELSERLTREMTQNLKNESDRHLDTKTNEKKTELDNYTNQLKADSRTEVDNYIQNNMGRIKGERGYGITNIEGNNGAVRITYSDGHNVDVPIPTVPGPKGDKGDRGTKGEKGDKGDGITNISTTEDGKLKLIYGNNSQEVITNIVGNDEDKLNISDAWKFYTKVIGNKNQAINLNDVVEVGEYVSNSNANKWLNLPQGLEKSFHLTVESIGEYYRVQTIRSYNDNRIFRRVNNHWSSFNSWSKWESIGKGKTNIIVERLISTFDDVMGGNPESYVKFKYNIDDYDSIIIFHTHLSFSGELTYIGTYQVEQIPTQVIKKLISIQQAGNSSDIGFHINIGYVTDTEIVVTSAIGGSGKNRPQELLVVIGIKY